MRKLVNFMICSLKCFNFFSFEQTLEYFDIERVSHVSENGKYVIKDDPDVAAAGNAQLDSNQMEHCVLLKM